MELRDALKEHFVKDLIRQTLGDEITIVERHSSFSIASKDEGERHVKRIILLPPHGYTANAPEQMNAHDEVEKATIEIKGAIREGKNGLSTLKNCLLLAALPENGAVSDLDVPYLTYDISNPNNPDLVLKRHSAGEAPFHVVRKDGFGFYHNLVNLTNEWLVLELNKTVRPMKPVDLAPHIESLPQETANLLNRFYQNLVLYGDEVFEKAPNLVAQIEALPAGDVLPALGEMLYARETGKHEACTAFGMILKMAKQNPDETLDYLETVLNAQAVPLYYARQLIEKIERKCNVFSQERSLLRNGTDFFEPI